MEILDVIENGSNAIAAVFFRPIIDQTLWANQAVALFSLISQPI